MDDGIPFQLSLRDPSLLSNATTILHALPGLSHALQSSCHAMPAELPAGNLWWLQFCSKPVAAVVSLTHSLSCCC